MASGITQKPKKSLFQRPLFKRPPGANTTRDNGTTNDLFSRSGSSYQAVVEEEEKRLARREAKVAQRTQDIAKGEVSESNAGTRRNQSVSSSDSSSDHDSDTERKSIQTRSSPYSPPQGKAATDFSKLDTKSTTDTATQQPEILELSDRDGSQDTIGKAQASKDDDELVITSATYKPSPESLANGSLTDDEDDPESDDELRELARQARATAKQKQDASKVQVQDLLQSFQHGNPFNASLDSQSPAKVKAPPVRIEIHSPLPGVEHRGFNIPLDKRVRGMRLIWCAHNGYSEEESKDIILVFRGKRVLNVDTPSTLGISVDDDGNPHVEGDDPLNPINDGLIIMEAIREDHMDAYKKKWTEDHGIYKSSWDQGKAEEEEEPHPREAQVDQKSIRIICRAKDRNDFKVLVKGSTTIARIQWAFIIQHSLHEDTNISIMFDGEKLTPEMTMAQLGADNMDIFEVQIK